MISEKSLRDYIRLVFDIVEPGRKYHPNWHTDAIADHLEAMIPVPIYDMEKDDEGKYILGFNPPQIRRLVINIPPGCTKSLILNVIFPSWVWGPLGLPMLRFLFITYSQQLTLRDSIKCRRIIESDWYRELWGYQYQLTSDQNSKIRYENNKSGFRQSTSLDGMATGERADFTGIDDPINMKEAIRPEQTALKRCNETYDNSISTRFMPVTGSCCICMQRGAGNDLSGYVLAKEFGGWEHLCLPMEYEGNNRCRTSLNFKDPRKKIGELLVPQRYPKEEIRYLKADLGSYGTASQLQQNPVAKEGGMFQTENFQIANQLPSNREKQIIGAIRYWDKAGTEGGGAYTAGVLMVRYADNTYYVLDVVRGQWEARQREPIIKQTAMNDKNLFPTGRYQVWTEQEPGSGGKESAQNTITSLAGLSVHADKVTGKKEVRAEPYSIQVENKNVYLVSGHWVSKFIQEHKDYLVGKYRDQVDAAGGAFNKLAFMKIARAI